MEVDERAIPLAIDLIRMSVKCLCVRVAVYLA